MKTVTDLTGLRSGRLTVTGYAYCTKYSGKNMHYWHCKCDCGNEVDVFGDYLRYGKTRSCGCLRTEAARENQLKSARSKKIFIERNGEKHSLKEWSEITGISFSKLYKRYIHGHTVDEIFSEKPLPSGGPRAWSPEKMISIEYKGQIKTIREWSKETGIPYSTMYRRYNENLPLSKVFRKGHLDRI